MELKWILAIVLEAGFWVMLAAFLLLRYRYGIEGVTRLFVVGVVLDTLGFVALGVWDYATTGHVNVYTAFIVVVVLYGVTSGKKHLQRLDAWMSRTVKPRRPRSRSGAAAARPCPERS